MVSQNIHENCKQLWNEHRTLLHTNLYFKPCSLFTLDFYCCFGFPIHFHHSLISGSITPFFLIAHQITSLGTRSKAFSKSMNATKRYFPTDLYFSTNSGSYNLSILLHRLYTYKVVLKHSSSNFPAFCLCSPCCSQF